MPCRSCSLWCRQFWLILLKNIILQVRRPIGTVFELLLPCLAVVVVIVLRFTLFQPSDRCFATFSTSPPLSNYRELTVYYTPNTTEASEVISRASAVLPNAVFLAANGEDAVLQEIANLDKQLHPLYAGLILPDDLEPTFEDISVTIRETHEVGRSNSWFTVRKAAIFSGFSPRRGSYYIQKGFVHLQNAVSIGLSLWKLNDTVAPPIVRMRLMAFPSYSSDIFLEGIVLALPALLVLGYLYSAGVFTQVSRLTTAAITDAIAQRSPCVYWTPEQP